MIQQQRFGGTLWGTPARLAREQGVACFLRGSLLTCGRESCYSAGYLGVVPASQRILTEMYGMNPNVGTAVGAIGGGLVCAFISQPMDTAKTCMQGDIERKKYTNFSGTIRCLHQEYGSFKSLYRGFWWRSANIVLELFFLDMLKRRLAPLMYPEKCH